MIKLAIEIDYQTINTLCQIIIAFCAVVQCKRQYKRKIRPLKHEH